MAGVGPGVGWVLSPPPSKENGGAAHCSPHGLVAYGAGSSVVVMEPRSMQLVAVLPMPASKNAPLQPAPFVTAVQWTPEAIPRDLAAQDSSTAHLQLAVGDRQGRVAIWDVASGDVCTWLEVDAEKGRQGIQDLCWVYGQPWLLAVIHGPTCLNIWDPTSGRCIWRFDSGGELLGCVRADPFDSRQFCLVGLRGLLLSILVGGVSESDILTKKYVMPGQDEKGTVVEKTKDAAPSSGSTSSGAPALASAPGVIVCCLYSRTRRGLVYVMMPREIVVVDLAFGMPLASTSLPRSCSKLLDLLACTDGDVLYCAHQDGKVTAWRRKEDKQTFSLCHMGLLVPTIGSPVPAPAVLAVVHCPLQLQVQTSSKDDQSSLQVNSASESIPAPSTLSQNDQYIETKVSSRLEATLLSVTDDGRLWRWVINEDGTESESASPNGVKLTPRNSGESNTSGELVHSSSNGCNSEPLFKLDLTGQLQLLPSSVTTLAIPMPSLLAMGTGVEGSNANAGAVSVPLVALACQGGNLELVDTAANTITASFAAHNNQTVRGVRWLGNKRLVSFSYVEVKGKGGGFQNRLVLTCVRSGHSKVFRVMQKPERSPMRALRTSPSGRYLLILFKEAPAEVWAMTRTPQMVRSLALPFTVMEWALPPAPKAAAAAANSWAKKSSMMKERPTIASAAAAANAPPSNSTADSQDAENAESFAFALVNGSLGVFELRGKRVRDFRPKWPAASFVSADVLITAMAYRTPHVVMGDRTGSIRWWDVVTGLSSSFSTHRGGIRRIKFAPVRIGDPTRGRIAVLFNDHSFAVYDLDTHDPLAHTLVQPHLGGILVLELDWYPLRPDKNEPLLLCIAGADGSFRLLEIQNLAGGKSGQLAKPTQWQRYRPMPLCCAALLPPPHALSLRVILQQGVQPSWFEFDAAFTGERNIQRTVSRGGDLRHHLLTPQNPIMGETVFAEVLLKALEPYRRNGRLLDEDRTEQYAAICRQGVATRCAFAAAQFGEFSETVFWLQLPRALALLSYGSAGPNTFWGTTGRKTEEKSQGSEGNDIYTSEVQGNKSLDRGMTFRDTKVTIPYSPEGVLPAAPFKLTHGCMDIIPSEQSVVRSVARERIGWHDKFSGTEATQRRVHELIAIGDFESAVTLLLATPPNDPLFYMDALRAVSLASAVSTGLHELAVKVVAANMVGTDDSLSGTHLLCAVGRYQEACSQLQDAGRWIDAATLAATHLKGSDHARVLERWAHHVLNSEHNLWRAMILFVAAGELVEALATLRNAKQPDTAAMFLLACHEAKVIAKASIADKKEAETESEDYFDLPGDLSHHQDEVQAVCEYYGEYQRHLAHACTGIGAVDRHSIQSTRLYEQFNLCEFIVDHSFTNSIQPVLQHSAGRYVKVVKSCFAKGKGSICTATEGPRAVVVINYKRLADSLCEDQLSSN